MNEFDNERATPMFHRTLFLIAGLCLAGDVLAQAGWRDMLPRLTEEDVDIVARTVRQELTGKPEGTVLEWRNDDSGNHGTVELVRRFDGAEGECRVVRHDMRIKLYGNWRKTVTVCRRGDDWYWADVSETESPPAEAK